MRYFKTITLCLFLFLYETGYTQLVGPLNGFQCGSTQSYILNGSANYGYTIFLSNGNIAGYTQWQFFTDQYGQYPFQVKWTGTSCSMTIYTMDGNEYGVYSISATGVSVSVSPSVTSISQGGNVVLTATTNGSNYAWTCNKTTCPLSSTNTVSVTASPTVTTIYTVTSTRTGCTVSGSATATVNVTASPITGNTVCCDKIICGSGDPTALGQQTGITLSGGVTPYSYQWQSSANNSTWTNISGATSSSYDPPTLSQTTYYRRLVNPGGSQSISNVTTATVIPDAINLSSTTYSSPTTIKANQTVSILGNLASTGTNQVNIKAGQGILVSPPSVLLPNITLAIEACAASLRTEEGEPIVWEETDQSGLFRAAFKIYPNPISNGYLKFGGTASTYSLINSSGHQVLQGRNTDQLDVTGLSKGLYLLKLDDKVEKVIVE